MLVYVNKKNPYWGWGFFVAALIGMLSPVFRNIEEILDCSSRSASYLGIFFCVVIYWCGVWTVLKIKKMIGNNMDNSHEQ